MAANGDDDNRRGGNRAGAWGGAGQPQIHTPFLLRAQRWINELVEYEATHQHPAPLSKAQKKILGELETTLAAPSPVEPVLGDTNWIGLLQEYRAANRIPGDSLSGPEYIEISGIVPGRSLPATQQEQWRYKVRIEEHAEPFPNAARGLAADGSVPPFAKKKDAMKYAAKCAIEWLRAQGYMPEVGVKFPKGPVPAATPRRARRQPSAASSSAAAPSSPSPATTTTPSNNGSAARRADSETEEAGTSVYGTDEPSAPFIVSELCSALHIQAPQYDITSDPEHKEFFSGRPVFDILDLVPNKLPPLPEGTGYVSNVFTRRLARQKIAEALVPHLRRALEAKRGKVRKWMEEDKARKAASSAGKEKKAKGDIVMDDSSTSTSTSTGVSV